MVHAQNELAEGMADHDLKYLIAQIRTNAAKAIVPVKYACLRADGVAIPNRQGRKTIQRTNDNTPAINRHFKPKITPMASGIVAMAKNAARIGQLCRQDEGSDSFMMPDLLKPAEVYLQQQIRL
jgi:hypothetical protein